MSTEYPKGNELSEAFAKVNEAILAHGSNEHPITQRNIISLVKNWAFAVHRDSHGDDDIHGAVAACLDGISFLAEEAAQQSRDAAKLEKVADEMHGVPEMPPAPQIGEYPRVAGETA